MVNNMKTKNILASLLAVAAVVALPACDDDEYTPGEQSPGVYFPADAPESYDLALDGMSFNVTVSRLGISEAATYSFSTVEYDNAIFSVPSTVSFAEGASTAEITITYDASKLEYDVEHQFTLAFSEEGTSSYGLRSYEFVALLPAPWTDWAELATGTYTCNNSFFGNGTEVAGMNLEMRENEITGALQYRIPGWVLLDSENETYTDLVIDATPIGGGSAICYVQPAYIGEHTSYGPIYMTDIYTYAATVNPEYIGNYPLSDFIEASFYQAEEGRFYLYTVYYCSEGVFSNNYEFFQLDGFNDYSVSVRYNGVYTDTNGDISAVLSATLGADATDVRAAIVGESGLQATLSGILDGSVDYEEVSSSNASRFFLPVPEAGSYTAVVAVVADNEVMQYATVQFTIEISGDDEDWTTLGEAEFLSGWIVPLFSNNQTGETIDPATMPILCDIQESKETPGYYRLKDPYHAGDFATMFGNEATSKGYIYIDAVESDFIKVPVAYCGFSATGLFTDGLDDVYLSDMVYYYHINEIDKATITQAGYYNEYDASLDCYIINDPCFGPNETEFIYGLWDSDGAHSRYKSEIYMPIGTNSPKRAVSRAIDHRIRSVRLDKTVISPITPQTLSRQPRLLNVSETRDFVNLKKLRNR